MLGAIVGDVVGSPYEFDRKRDIAHSKVFPLVIDESCFTDDTVLTLAVAEAIMSVMPKRGMPIDEKSFSEAVKKSMRKFAERYPKAGYGARFMYWLLKSKPQPYGSFGNGSAMRVSPIGWAFDDLETTERFAEVSAEMSHNHPEGIKGAQATASAIFMARTGSSKDEIKSYIINRYGYDLSRTLDEIRPKYHHVETCQETVPEAITAFLEGNSFEDVTRCAVSLGGDSDTLTAIACSIAEGMYGIPDEIDDMILPKLDGFLTDVLLKWELWRA
ncbi:MAG: ADP-ribosylglycohydrolase family protein [Synergistaceae bacterium]|nr:ADP-ribosylglycohydrolase family protein [Synergistaceae bacterium]MBR0150927.1 ADP-ribosylglycohydrolase family protein [Synergistaceae bacterium]